jgi:hypothetical protein
MNAGIEEIAANENMNYGETNRDQVLKEEVLRQVLYTEAGQLTVGTNVIGTDQLSSLSVDFTYPGEASAEYPVDHDATTERQRITWSEFSMKLYQAQTRYAITDGAKLEGMSDMQMPRTRRRASEALARRKDENILKTLEEGAVSENTESLPSGDEWDQDNVDIVDELWDMWTDILVNAPLNSMDVSNFAVILPVEIWAQLNQTELINNVQQRLRDYLGQTFGFEMYPTKMGMHDDHNANLQDTAIMMVPGGDTAVHATLDPQVASNAGVPLTEQRRNFARGEEWLVKQWFNTKVFSHESGEDDVSPRISVRQNINSNSDAR